MEVFEMKKTVAIALVLLLAVCSLAIGAQAEEEMLTLSVLGHQRSGITFEEVQTIHAWDVLMDMFAENNLVLDFTVVEADQYNTVLNATIASGDMPDFFKASLSETDKINLIESGQLMNIDDALAYSDGTASFEFSEDGLYSISRQQNTYVDGGMYFFGNVSKQIAVDVEDFGSNAIVGNNCAMLMRQDWLDALDLDMPTTTAEVLEVLRAFQDNDMNGNGLRDERICLDVDSYFNGVAQWFGLAPFVYQYNHSTGKAEVPVMQDGFDEYIAFMKELVDAGVLFLGDEVSYYNAGTSEGSSLGAAMQENSVAAYYGVALADHALQPEGAVYAIMPNIQGAEGIAPVMNVSVGYKVWGGWAFSSAANPEAVAAFLDTICTKEYAIWVTFGVEGETYTIDPESGLYTFTASNVVADILETKVARGYPLVIDSFLPDASQIGWYQEYYGPLNWTSYSDFLDSAYFRESIATSYPEHQIANFITWCKYAEETQKYNFNEDLGMIAPMNTLEEADTLSFYEADLDTYMSEMLSNLINGTYSLEELDAYRETLYSLGLQEVWDVHQAQYDRMV